MGHTGYYPPEGSKRGYPKYVIFGGSKMTSKTMNNDPSEAIFGQKWCFSCFWLFLIFVVIFTYTISSDFYNLQTVFSLFVIFQKNDTFSLKTTIFTNMSPYPWFWTPFLTLWSHPGRMGPNMPTFDPLNMGYGPGGSKRGPK